MGDPQPTPPRRLRQEPARTAVLEGWPGDRLLRPTLADEALLALATHRMLTVAQLREMLTPDASTTTRWSSRLNQLQRAGLVRSLPSRGVRVPKVWCCTRAGLRVALAGQAEPRSYEVSKTGGILVAHTLAVNETGLAFVRAARQHGHDCTWLSWEHEVAHTIRAGRGPGRTLISDAVLTYNQTSSNRRATEQFFIEVDRATMPIQRLVAKVRAYVEYRKWAPKHHDAYGLSPGGRAWQARYPDWPTLMVVIGANPAKDHKAIDRRINQLRYLCLQDPHIYLALTERNPFSLHTCRYDDLIRHGPFGAIWSWPITNS